MFREIREISKEERLKREEEERKNRAYLQIKPEKIMTMKEMEDFWTMEFNRIAMEAAEEA